MSSVSSVITKLGGWPARALVLVLAAGCAHGVTRRTDDEGRFEVVTLRLDYNNVHAVVSDGSVLLIDAGTQEAAPRLDRRLRRAGIDPSTITGIILTHGHADHAGGASWFAKRYGTPIFAGAGDRALLEEGRNDELCPTDARAKRRQAGHQSARFTSFEPTEWIAAPTDLSSRVGVPVRVVPLPGHTEGSLVVLAGPHAFVGDVFRGSILGRSAARHFYMCDLPDNDRDIRELLLGEAARSELFFVGHFGPVPRDEVERRWPTAGVTGSAR